MRGPDSKLLLDKSVAWLDICRQEVLLFDKLKHTSNSNVLLWIFFLRCLSRVMGTKWWVQFRHPPLDGSTSQSWCIKLARKDKHVHIYKQERRDACRCLHELHYIWCAWKRDRMSRWYCSSVHRSVSVSEIVYTMWPKERRSAVVAPLLAGIGPIHDSSFHIWMFSSLRSIPLPVPEGWAPSASHPWPSNLETRSFIS